MECEVSSLNSSELCDENHYKHRSRGIDISTLLDHQSQNISNKEEWRKEVDKLYKRPNIKLRKAHSLLTASLKNNGPPNGFCKYLAEYKKKTPQRTVTGRVPFGLPITGEVSRHVNRETSQTLLASTLASVTTINTFTSKRELEPANLTENHLVTVVSGSNVSNTVYNKNDPSSSNRKSTTSHKTKIAQTEGNTPGDRRVRLSPVCIQERSIQEEPRKSNSDPQGQQGFVRKHFGCMRSSSNKLLNVYTIDDGIRPQTITKVAANETTTVKRFQRPCGTNSREDRPLPRGHVPKDSCVERAFFITINSKESLSASEKSNVRKSKYEVKKLRPKSAQPSGYFKFLNKNLHEHINDTIVAKGRINLLYPMDRTKVFKLLKEELYNDDIDVKLEDLYNKCLQKRLNFGC